MRVTRDMRTMTTRTTTMMMINPWDGVLVPKVTATWIAWRRKFFKSYFFGSEILCCSQTLSHNKKGKVFTPIQNTSSAIHFAQRIRLVRSWIDSPTASTTICQLSATVYSAQLQVPVISGHRQPSGATLHPRQRKDTTASYWSKNPTGTPTSPTSPSSTNFELSKSVTRLNSEIEQQRILRVIVELSCFVDQGNRICIRSSFQQPWLNILLIFYSPSRQISR